jgi:hypothetical protein
MNPPIVMMISAYDPNPTIPLKTINSPNAMRIIPLILLTKYGCFPMPRKCFRKNCEAYPAMSMGTAKPREYTKSI